MIKIARTITLAPMRNACQAESVSILQFPDAARMTFNAMISISAQRTSVKATNVSTFPFQIAVYLTGIVLPAKNALWVFARKINAFLQR